MRYRNKELVYLPKSTTSYSIVTAKKALENARSCEGNKRKTVPFDVVASMMLNELSRDEFRRTI
jgi:hypothetical protein